MMKSRHHLMPVPASLRFDSGRLAITATFAVAVAGHRDRRLEAGIDRFLQRLESRTGMRLERTLSASPDNASLVIRCQGPGKTIPSMDEDESYGLEVSGSQAILKAATVVGALRGLETLLQLLDGDSSGYFIPAVSIEDSPRFPWRGLMIDVCRHWQPIEVIKRNLDAMAAVKLNVLHLHLTEDQGFRIESKKYPKLHRLGSDGNYFTQDQMRELIEYARMRGIRVVPEFDLPGHATSWLVGHPEFASLPGPYQIERRWGIFDPTLDPTNEAVYKMLDGLLGEMAALFPDAWFHIGGDENNGKQWDANPKIQAFIKSKNLADNHGLQAYFNRRVQAILKKHGKRMIGWDEILHPDLSTDIVVQSWRGQKSLAEGAKKGYPGILSNGYYIDLMQPAHEHYLNDPIPENSTLTPEEQKLILGGEATMWSEWTTPELIDSRIWPRTAAIAERLWSPSAVIDVDDMYRRLEIVSVWLEELGLLHKKNYDVMVRRLAGPLGSDEHAVSNLRSFVDLVEPVKRYRRGRLRPDVNQLSPLTTLCDAALPESRAAREFGRLVDGLIEGRDLTGPIKAHLEGWRKSAALIESGIIPRSPILAEAGPLLADLREICAIGIEATDLLAGGKSPAEGWRESKLKALEEAGKPKAAVEIALVGPVRRLVTAEIRKTK